MWYFPNYIKPNGVFVLNIRKAVKNFQSANA